MLSVVIELKVHIFLNIFSAHWTLASSLHGPGAGRNGDEDGTYENCQCESHGYEVEERSWGRRQETSH